ncbi:hypothetical protein [Paracoccus alcaliphilus]|uniref:hypothetical protein n=1 Tax=Paracoccus alcaliphilus TaxID=34002 RepID=UPI00147E263E|nr:hypothetical protein [Paracoccus alcaliphilus]WCR17381.1 hypothetical protein JHW40_13670 [Paracoccus alcaliphilus]
MSDNISVNSEPLREAISRAILQACSDLGISEKDAVEIHDRAIRNLKDQGSVDLTVSE